jgi:hypothetical protein
MDAIAEREHLYVDLALMRDGKGRFPVHPDAVTWLVQRWEPKAHDYTTLFLNGDLLRIPIDSTYADLCEAVEHQPGRYRVIMLNSRDMVIPGEMGHLPVWNRDAVIQDAELCETIEAEQENAGQMTVICQQLITSRDRHDELKNDLLKDVVARNNALQIETAKQQTAMQTSMARLLDSATNMINAMSQHERRERDPIDVAAVSRQVAEALSATRASDRPWIADVANGPMGQMVAQAGIAMTRMFASSHMAPPAAGSPGAGTIATGATARAAATSSPARVAQAVARAAASATVNPVPVSASSLKQANVSTGAAAPIAETTPGRQTASPAAAVAPADNAAAVADVATALETAAVDATPNTTTSDRRTAPERKQRPKGKKRRNRRR